MRLNLKTYVLLGTLVLTSIISRAQLTGTLTVPSTTYPDLASAVTALNTQGVGAGGATISITTGNPQTAPVGGYLLGSATLNASLSSANTLTILGNANTVTANTGTGTADGIFKMLGVDYVTIDGLNLTDATANTTTTTQMEWGFALVKRNTASPFDGCQYNTIKNCTITLKASNSASKAIYAAHISATGTSLSTTGAGAGDANSFNTFAGNNISNVSNGIYLNGISSAVPAYDKSNVIGGATTGAGNTIAVGGSANTSYGVYVQYDSLVSFRGNSFTIVSAQTGATYQIYAGVGVGDMNLTNNSFNFNCATTTASIYGFYTSFGHSDVNSTFIATGNTFFGNNPTATSSYLYAFYNYYHYCLNQTFSNNTFSNITWGTTSGTYTSTGYVYLAYNYYAGANNLTVDNNVINNITKYTPGTSVSYIYGYYFYNYNAPAGTFTYTNNKFKNVRNSSYYTYTNYTYAGYPSQKLISKFNKVDSLDVSNPNYYGYVYNYMGYYGADSSEVAYDTVSNITAAMGSTYYSSSINTYFGYFLYAPILGSSHHNYVNNINCSSTSPTLAPSINTYIGYYANDIHDNTMTNVLTAGGSMTTYTSYYGTAVEVKNNTFSNIGITSGSGTFYNYLYNGSSYFKAHDNRFNNLNIGTGTFYGLYMYTAGTADSFYNNNVGPVTTTVGTSNSIYMLYMAGGVSDLYLYNNYFAGMNVPATYAATNLYGLYLSSSLNYKLYHNTIRMSPVGSTSQFGATGVYFGTGGTLDVRNNIINVNALPAGTGTVVALRRSSGSSGTVPSNFSLTSNGNIYYTPNVANSYLYGEGTSSTSMTNGYNLTNDANFNTPCGLYKTFMSPRESSSFTENNLIAGSLPNTWIPTGTTFAKSVGVPTFVSFDYNNVTRPTPPDAGALQFSATATDAAGPIISYNPFTATYCTGPPTLTTTITDVSGVSTTNPPRAYYKLTTETNAFGANNNTFSGWKYVTGNNTTGNTWTFALDYTLLTSTPGTGNTIQYFVVAQDNATPTNVGTNLVGLSACPSSVAIPTTTTVNSTPAVNSYIINSLPTSFVAIPSLSTLCNSGTTTLVISPTPVGATVQWQQDNGSGFTNISGANNPTYTSNLITSNTRFRAQVICGGSVVATTTIDTIVVATPQLISTTGATRCGLGTVTLTGTANSGSSVNWYASATSTTPLFTGTSFTTPQIGGTTTYYAAASVANASVESAGKQSMTPYSSYYPSGPYGVQFNLSNTSNIYSTLVYPTGTGTFQIQLTDASGSLITGIGTNPINVTIATSNVGTAMTIPLGWTNVPAGVGYKLSTTATYTGAPTMNIEYLASNFPWPYNSPSGNISITNSFYSTTTYLNYYYFFYNIVASGPCSTPRTPVVATVTPAPAISVSSPNSPGICTGTTATLNVSSANAGYSYLWTPSSTLSCSTCTNPTASPTSVTTYVVTATDNSTGSNAGCVTKDSVKLYVNAVPAAPTVSPTSATICAGSSAILTGTIPTSSAGITGIIGSGTSTVTAGQPTPYYHFYTGNHNQYLILASELTALGFTPGNLSSIGFYVTSAVSNTVPWLNYQINMASTNLTSLSTIVSAGMQNVYFNATPTLPSTTGWTTVNFTTPFAWDGVSNVIVDVSHMNCTSCPTTSCSSYGSTVPVAQTNTSFNSCLYTYADGNCSVNTFAPTSTVYTSVSRPNMQLGFTFPININWQPVTGLYKNATLTTTVATNDTNKVVYASPVVNTTYTALSNLQGCKSGPSNPVTVTINPVPVTTISSSPGAVICAGQTTTLTAGQTGTGYSYQWRLGGVAITGATNNTYTTGTAGAYTVTVTNLATGCTATTPTPTNIVVNPVPTNTLAASGPTTFCIGGSVTLNTTAAIGTGFTYQWYNGATLISGANTASYIATTGGTYTNVVTNSNGCTTTSNPITVTVNITPAVITPLGSTTFCPGFSVGLQASTGSNLTYQWQLNGAPISGATNSLYTASASGSYTVIVYNTATTCSATSTPVVVNASSPPSSAITPTPTAAVCDGSSLTLSTNNAPGLAYQWYKNGVAISGATAQTYTQTYTIGGGGGSYTVNVSVGAGCSSTTAIPTVVTVNPLPTVSASAAGNTTFCQGGSALLSAGAGAGLTYQWYNGSTPITGATAPTYSATASGSYTVRGTNANGCVGISNAIGITVNPLPTISATATGPTTFCQGGSVIISAAPSTGLNYQWKLNNVAVTGGTASTYSATASGNYTVTATDANGCSSTSIPPVTVIVNPLPNVATTPSGTVNVCSGSTTTISVPTAPNQTYQWTQGGTTIVGATGNSYTTGVAGNYSVMVANTATTCQATSSAVTVAINPLPLATIATSGATTICQGDTAKLNANTGVGYTYQWKLNGNNIAGGTGVIYNAIIGGSYTVAVTNTFGCTVVSSPVTIIVNPTPLAYITYNSPISFCDGSAVVLNANTGAGLNYQWYLNGLPIGNTSTSNISATNGSYTLKVTNSFGCVGTSVPVNVTVWQVPQPVITMTNYVLSAGGPYSTYQWYYNNQPISGAINQTINPTQNGAYKVRVTDVHNCPANSEQFFVNTLGVSGTAAVRNAIKVYPNPASSILHIDAPVKVKLVLRDVSGKAVLSAEGVKELDITNVANGLYLLYVNDTEGHLLKAEKITKTDQ